MNGTVVRRLYPKNLDQSTLDKIVHDGDQQLVIEQSTFNEGLFARIFVPAPEAMTTPASVEGTAPPAWPAACAGSASRQEVVLGASAPALIQAAVM